MSFRLTEAGKIAAEEAKANRPQKPRGRPKTEPHNIKPRDGKRPANLPNVDGTPASVCGGCGREVRRCAECNQLFGPKRSDAITCSNLCRQSRHQRLKDAKAKGKDVEA